MPMEKEQHISAKANGDAKAIQHLKEAIAQGRHWYLALLEAIGLWTSAGENYKGRRYCYLIDNEAFDWLVLAGRLSKEVNGFIPEEELINLLFFARPPIELSKDEFKNLIGEAKYQAYLNYSYGVLVEEILLLTVVNEIRKRRSVSGLTGDGGVVDEAYRHIYGATQEELARRFRQEKHYPQHASMSLTEVKEFTYWLFKQRIKQCDKSCVASDTKKALIQLHSYLQRSCKKWNIKLSVVLPGSSPQIAR
jgi:hypothetical protein